MSNLKKIIHLTKNKLFSKFFKRINLLGEFPYISSISSDDIYFSRSLYKFLKLIFFLEYKKRNKYKYSVNKSITDQLSYKGYSLSSNRIYKLFENSNLKEKFNGINWQGENVNMRKKWMWYFKPEIDRQLVFLLNELAKELSGYLDGLPVLRSVYFWKSFPNETDSKYKGSQLFHMDNNDWRQIRVFYAINDVNSENGSPEFISSKKSEEIYKSFKKKDHSNLRNLKREDKLFEKYKGHFISKSLNSGKLLYLDTGNCYHRGSRNMTRDRDVFVAQFMTPFHIHTKLINRSQDYLMPAFIREDFLSRHVFKYYYNSKPQKGY